MSDEQDTVQINTRGLDKLIGMLKGKLPYARVGILGLDNARSSGGLTNSELGAIHEFGAPAANIKPRSFLRVPLATKLQGALKDTNAFDPETFKKVIESGDLKPWIRKLGIVGENVVVAAFATGGYGQWPAWKNKNYKNNSGMLLVDSTQLRNSITSDVVE